MSNLFFSSDTHYFHANVLNLCPNRQKYFSTVEEMNEGLIQRHNAMVSSDDVFIHLGDIVMGPRKETISQIIPKLNGEKYLLLGNHDLGFPNNTRKAQIYIDNGIKAIIYGHNDLRMFLASHTNFLRHREIPYEIKIGHFPYVNNCSQYDVKFKKFMPDGDNHLLLHGHSHHTEKISSSNSIHIGVDAWEMCPVSWDEILETYSDMQNEFIDNHR